MVFLLTPFGGNRYIVAALGSIFDLAAFIGALVILEVVHKPADIGPSFDILQVVLGEPDIELRAPLLILVRSILGAVDFVRSPVSNPSEGGLIVFLESPEQYGAESMPRKSQIYLSS